MNELTTHSKNKNIRKLYRRMNEFKDFQPRTYLIIDVKGDFLADSYNILNRWKNYFSHLLNVHRVCNVRLKEIQTVQPAVPEPFALRLELLSQS
jgi:hypothetical protein